MLEIDQDSTPGAGHPEYPRIRFVTRHYDDAGGGLGRYERELAAELSLKCDVEILRAKPWPIPRLITRAAQALGRDLETVLRENRSFVPGPRIEGVFHLSNQELALSLLWQRYRAPTVVTVHDLISVAEQQTDLPDHTPELVERLILWQWTRGLRRADHLIAVSQWTKNDLINRLHIDPERISVVYQSVDTQLFNPAPVEQADELQHFGLERSDRYLLYVGSLHPRKDVPTLIRAMAIVRAEHPDVRLVLAGSPRLEPGAGSVARIHSEIERLGLHDAVIGTGQISDQNLVALYQGAMATVVPSHYEGFGYPVIEAMACGCPVITSDATCLPEIVGDAGLLFSSGNERALAEQLLAIAGNSSLANQLRDQGMERAQQFSPDDRLRKTLAVYQLVTH